ncbi:fibrinogen C domain-containing protein 1-B-like isoform X3 [Diabrotica virgifera virgifera]|uniref:Fibrinogen C-terminal domain-containing protein n=1 Tax=Diabrotica virgifera virgifera TaxID=50390 RepID=A0ABM5KWG8_DIAVI|nr:fibrinogen C domain-containing protein 1-B-like isoform X3 [Diabrotica virgifera virgifera]
MSVSTNYLKLALIVSLILSICGNYLDNDQQNRSVQEEIKESSPIFKRSAYYGKADGTPFKNCKEILESAFEANELLVELVDKDGISAYALYDSFAIGSEVEGYYLSTLKGYSGDAGDSLSNHLGQKFTTLDLDQDQKPDGNCAEIFIGAWWYNNCYESHLNGKFRNIRWPAAYKYKGIVWFGFKNNEYFLSQARMLIRPKY